MQEDPGELLHRYGYYFSESRGFWVQETDDDYYYVTEAPSILCAKRCWREYLRFNDSIPESNGKLLDLTFLKESKYTLEDYRFSEGTFKIKYDGDREFLVYFNPTENSCLIKIISGKFI